LAHLAPRGWIAAGALIVAETARDEALPVSDRVTMSLLAERSYGAARVSAWRAEALVG
jgi:16S rRNA G966 N2-methylase RsmD